MEQLFMQVFERRDWVAAQVQQQADSYAQTLACTLLAAGHRPPDWLLPSRAGEPQQELNGKPIVPGLIFTGSQITTPAANRTVFLPPAIHCTSIRKLDVPDAYTRPVNNGAVLSTLADMDAEQHEEPQPEQTLLSKELVNTCAEPSMFSRIQRSKSRQRNIEGRSPKKDQAANSGSCDGTQDAMEKTNLGAVESNRTTLSSSSRSCANVVNDAETSSACPDQENGFHARQGRSTDFLKCHNHLGSQGKELDCLPSLALEDKVICSDNNRSIGNLPIVPLPKHMELNIADNMCHAMPSTHLLVEPKKLQFDGVESACVGSASEETGQQQESALERDHFGPADRNLLSEGPYPTSSLQEPNSIGRSSLDDLKSSKSIDADVKHNQYDLEYSCHDLSAMHSLIEEPSLNCSAEVPGFLGDPLPQKNTLHVPEINSLGRARSTVSQTQEMVMLNSDETNCSEISHSVVNPILEKDTLQTVEDTKQLQSPNSNVSPVQLPTQLADAKFEANASSGRSVNSLLGEDERVHLPNLLTNGINSKCSLGRSSVSKAQLPPQIFTPDNVCQSSPLSYGTHSNGIHSNGFAAADAFESVESVLPQDQYLLARPSLEFGGCTAEADAPLGHTSLDTHSEILKGNSVSELENCHSGKWVDDVHVNKAHYSSGFDELMCLKSEAKNAATKSKNSVASDALENGDTSPELKKHSHVSNVAICNSSSEEALLPNFNHSNGSRSAVERTDFQNSQPQFQNNFDMPAPSALPCCSSITPDTEERYAKQENLCLGGQPLSVNISSAEHLNESIQADEVLYHSGTGLLTILPSNTLDQHVKQASDLVASANKKLSFESDVKHDTGCECEDSMRFLLSDATMPRQKGDESVDCNNEMPEFERFNVSLPFESPATKKRTFEALYDSRRFGTLSSDISCKVNTVTGMHQLSAPMSKKATSYSFSGDARQYSMSSDGSIADIFGACGFGISGSFLPSDDIASCSSNDCDKHMSGENPLTPAVEKYSLGKLSTRVGSVSEHMGSIPELSCFRIDEDSGIAEENEYQDVLPESVGNQDQSGRKALQDITGLCQSAKNSTLHSLGFVSKIDFITETCGGKLSQNSGLRNDHNYKKPKEKSASLVKREGKVAHSLHNRLSKIEVTDNRNQRNMSDANLGKRSKPGNIVANVSSFIPLVKTKQQSTTACVKKDVRVKALEAAEAAKRLEEKKQNEREMRKAAAKLEREKIKQEKESKQKQEQEQKKKQDIDMATKKRQRDEEERKEKEKKRRCAEEARKQQKQPIERRHADIEKDAHPKASDNKELRNNLVGAVKGEVKPGETIDPGNKATTSNNTDMAVNERPSSLGSHAKENIPNNLDESYVMTPYKDSDDEDEDEEASRRRKKPKPSWVREENLMNILLSDNHRALDPREIFAQKRSFNLSEVLPAHVPMGGFR